MYGNDYLRAFGTTNAAKDINFVVQAEAAAKRTSTTGYTYMMYGESFGTFLAQRYMKLFPAGEHAMQVSPRMQVGYLKAP